MRSLLFLAFLGLLASTSSAADRGPAVAKNVSPGTIQIRAIVVNTDGSVDNPEVGSGIVITESGFVLTASHVVPDSLHGKDIIIGGTLSIETPVKTYQLEIVKRSKEHDALLLRFVAAPPGLRPIPVRTKRVAQGERLFVLGYPLGLPDVHFLEGIASSITDSDITTDALVDRGNSGGPVVDENGCLVGLVYGALTENQGMPVNGLKFAVPIMSLADMLPNTVRTEWPDQVTEPAAIIHVTDILDRTQIEHGIKDTIVAYHDVINARPGYEFESIEGVGHNSLNPPKLQYPIPVISSDKRTVTLDYNLISGPIYDQWRGWIEMTIATRQKRIETAVSSPLGQCN